MPKCVPYRCLVPIEAIALITGHDGSRVKHISKESGGANIQVSGDGDTPPSLSDRIVTINGDASQKEAACRMVIERLYEAQEVAVGDHGIFVVLVPSASAAFLLGPEGSTLGKIVEESGAEVVVEPEVIAGTQDQPVRIVGGLDATVTAAAGLGKLLQDAAENGSAEEATVDLSTAAAGACDGKEQQEPLVEKVDNTESAPEEDEDDTEAPEEDAEEVVNEVVKESASEQALQKLPIPVGEHTDDTVDRQTEESAGDAARAAVTGALEAATCASPVEVDGSEEERVELRFFQAPSSAAATVPSPEPDRRQGLVLPCRCLAPTDAVGLIVGKGGQSIRQMSRETGSKITVSNDKDTPPSLSDRIVTVEGDPSQQVLACRRIIEKLFEVQKIGADEEGIFVLLVPQESFSLLEEKVSLVGQDVGAEVILEEETIDGTEDKPVRVIAGLEKTVAAAARINELLQDFVDSGHLPKAVVKKLSSTSRQKEARPSSPSKPVRVWSRGDDRPLSGSKDLRLRRRAEIEGQDSGQLAVRFAVSSAVAAWVVGRKGQSIKDMRSSTGATVEVSKDGGHYRSVDVSGAYESVMSAIQRLMEQVETLPDGAPENIRLVLPPGKAGSTVGRAEALKELRRASRADIEVLSQGGEKILQLGGDLEAVVCAAQMVAAQLAEVADSDPSAPGDSVGASSEAAVLQALLSSNDGSQASLTLLLPSEPLQRLLVPRDRLKGLMQKTRSRIELEARSQAKDRRSVHEVTITGTRLGNAMAILSLQEMLADALQTPLGSGAASGRASSSRPGERAASIGREKAVAKESSRPSSAKAAPPAAGRSPRPGATLQASEPIRKSPNPALQKQASVTSPLGGTTGRIFRSGSQAGLDRVQTSRASSREPKRSANGGGAVRRQGLR